MSDLNNLHYCQQRILELEEQLARTETRLSRESEKLQAEDDKNAGLNDRYNHLLQLLPAGVVIIDGSGIVSDANPAAKSLLGTPLKGVPWFEIIRRSFAPKSDDGHEVSLKDGRKVSLLTQAMDVEPGQLLLLTDQTETRLLQSRLSHYQRLSEMGRMMASLAHQIRTPLSAALLYVDHLMRPDLQLEQRQKFAGKVKSRLSNLEQQVRDMLVFARGEMRLDDTISSGELMAALEDQLDLPLVTFDADCDCENLAPKAQIQCNREALLGVCINLVENALQASGKGSELQIKFSESQGMLQLDISDQGPGMTDEEMKNALQPFYTTKSHGTGLGLAVAQVVAHAHNGSFRLTSATGVGTTASICVPCIVT